MAKMGGRMKKHRTQFWGNRAGKRKEERRQEMTEGGCTGEEKESRMRIENIPNSFHSFNPIAKGRKRIFLERIKITSERNI